VCDEETTANADAAKECCKAKLKDVLRGYLPQIMYNADKTAFFIRRYQTRQQPTEEKSVPMVRTSNERLTALFCYSSTGTCKL
jgi:hypothetical protein